MKNLVKNTKLWKKLTHFVVKERPKSLKKVIRKFGEGINFSLKRSFEQNFEVNENRTILEKCLPRGPPRLWVRPWSYALDSLFERIRIFVKQNVELKDKKRQTISKRSHGQTIELLQLQKHTKRSSVLEHYCSFTSHAVISE